MLVDCSYIYFILILSYLFFHTIDYMPTLNSNMPENMDTKDLECPDTTTDAVFGEITEEGPNYRSVSEFNLRRLVSWQNNSWLSS